MTGAEGAERRRRSIADLIGEEPALVKRGRGRPRKDGLPVGSVPPKPKRPPGRPKKESEESLIPKFPKPPRRQSTVAEADESANLSSEDVSAILLYGVSVQQLARLFRMTRHGVEKKLRNVRPIDLGPHGNPVYDLADAAGHLIPPKIDLEEYLSSIKPEQLPDHLRETFWNAKLKRQRFEENAGDLWRTKKVMGVIGEIFLDFASKLALIPDQVERQTGFTPEQYRLVRAIVDSIREEMVEDAERLGRGEDVTNQLGESEDDD